MAKKLRFRFVLISMLSLAAIIVVIMLIINITNYAEVRVDADQLLETIEEGGGAFFKTNLPDLPQEELPPETFEDGNNRPLKPFNENRFDGTKRFSEETPYETRYFTVTRAPDGTYFADINQIAAIDAREAVEYARTAIDSGKQKGYIGVYRYLVADDGKMVLFVDCFRQLSTARRFLNTSLIVAAAALVGMFILVFLFSKRAVKPIVEAYERQKQFVTEASHELKTPITIISANNELLQLEFGENESSDAIEHQVKRLSAMVKNLVSLSKLDEATTVEKGACDLSGCVAEHIELYRNALTANERNLQVDIDEGVSIEGNLDLLAQLTSILLDNAIKYADTYTEVHLKKDKNVVLTVKNDAQNLTDGDKSRCFERFYRDADVAQNIEGSGIGLAIAKQIVTLHKGTIAANAKNGVFTITVTL